MSCYLSAKLQNLYVCQRSKLEAMLDWNDLRFFLAVARQGSTLAAARH
jgi:hypothetical protein